MQRLTVLVGAGASVPIGVPGTKQTTELVLKLDDSEHFRSGGLVPVFREVDTLLRRYYTEPSFELILHMLETMHAFQEGSGLAMPMERILTSEFIEYVRPMLKRDFDLYTCIKLLYGQLHETLLSATTSASSHSRWPDYCEFWRRLGKRFALDIATLNYDGCTELALPHAEDGFELAPGDSVCRFDHNRFFDSGDNARIMHLHGSIHYGANNTRYYTSGPWSEREDVCFFGNPTEAIETVVWSARSEYVSQHDKQPFVGPLITGMHKTDKVLAAEPYSSYYHAFADCLRRSPLLLVIGYGFGDKHINALIGRMGQWHGSSRRIALVDYVESGSWPGFFHHEAWHLWADEPCYAPGHVFDGRIWRAKGGWCLGDFGGFLSRSSQLDDIINSFTS